MGEAGGGGVKGGETAEKLACIAMEFSWPAGRELRVGGRDTDHPPLLDKQTDRHTPQPVSGGRGQWEWARDLRPRDGVCKDQRAGGQK